MERDVIICAIAKHENDYIEEWSKHHFNIGFDKIYIIDDNEDDYPNISKIPYINQQINNDKLTIIKLKDICTSENYRQMNIYSNFYTQFNFQWCLFIDIDEFLILNKHNNIKDYLNQDWCKNACCINFVWKQFGDNEKIFKEKGLVVDRFPIPSKKFITYNNNEIEHKIIIRKINNASISMLNPHMAYIKGNVENLKYYENNGTLCKSISPYSIINYDDIQLNHYYTKSMEEYVKTKLKRNRIDINILYDTNFYWNVSKLPTN